MRQQTIRAVAGVLVLIVATMLSLTGCGQKPVSQPDAGDPSTVGGTAAPNSGGGTAQLGPGAAINDLSFTGTITVDDESYALTGWVLGNKVRFERSNDEDTAYTVIDGDAKIAAMWTKKDGIGVKVIAASTLVTESPVFWARVCAGIPDSMASKETLDGVACRVITIPSDSGDGGTVWIAEQTGLPVRVENESSSGGKTVITYTSITLGSPSADVFSLPGNITFTGP